MKKNLVKKFGSLLSSIEHLETSFNAIKNERQKYSKYNLITSLNAIITMLDLIDISFGSSVEEMSESSSSRLDGDIENLYREIKNFCDQENIWDKVQN